MLLRKRRDTNSHNEPRHTIGKTEKHKERETGRDAKNGEIPYKK